MLRGCLFGMIALTMTVSALGQQTKTKAPQPKVAPGSVQGYTIKLMEGFTVLLSDEVVKEDEKSKLERKPLVALAWEFQTVNKLLPPNAVKALHNVLIWAEWDQQIAPAS